MNATNNKSINNDVVAFVLAGGEGTRLRPLTTNICKPAVEFGLDNNLVDFVIGNLINSGINKVYVIAQYQSRPLTKHVQEKWSHRVSQLDGFIEVLVPQDDRDSSRYLGTADAIFKNLDQLKNHNPKHVAIFSADHIYRMDIRKMLQQHVEKNSDLTISSVPVPIESASSLGVLSVDTFDRIITFREKPSDPSPIPSDPSLAHASMGNYIIKADVLRSVAAISMSQGLVDFGHDIIGWIINQYDVHSYDFRNNEIPGMKKYEDSSYWYDVGSIHAYWKSHQDLLGHNPVIDLDNPHWPIGDSEISHFNKVYDNSLVSLDAKIDGAFIKNSIIRSNVVIESGAVVKDSIILGDAIIRKGAFVQNAIIAQNNIIHCDVKVGINQQHDQRRYHLDPSGIVVVENGHHDAAYEIFNSQRHQKPTVSNAH